MDQEILIIDLTQDSDSDDDYTMEEVGNTSFDIGDPTSEEEKQRQVYISEVAGNAFDYYKDKNYRGAILFYNLAIKEGSRDINHFYLKSKCHYYLEEIKEAIKEAENAALLAWGNGKFDCLLWMLQLGIETANLKYSEDVIKEIMQGFAYKSDERNFRNLQDAFGVLKDYMSKLNVQKDSPTILNVCSKILEIAPHSVKIILAQTRAFMNVEKYWDARSSCVSVLRKDPGNIHALYFQSQSAYQSVNFQQTVFSLNDLLENLPKKTASIKKFICNVQTLEQELLKIDYWKSQPTEFFVGENMKLIDENMELVGNSVRMCQKILLSAGMHNKEIEAKVSLSLGQIAYKIGNLKQALEMCDKVIGLTEDNTGAYLLKGDVYLKQNDYEKTAAMYNMACKKDPNSVAIKKKILDACDLYKTLNVSSTATQKEISAAYKKSMLKYHPDKNVGASENQLKLNKEMMERIQKLYAILGDVSQRQEYDLRRMAFEKKYLEKSYYMY